MDRASRRAVHFLLGVGVAAASAATACSLVTSWDLSGGSPIDGGGADVAADVAADGTSDGGAIDSGTDAPVDDAKADAGPIDSCKAQLRANPAAAGKDGVYVIDPDGTGPLAPINAWCDMTTNAGGWTLVARGVANAAPEHWGWGYANGSVNDDTQPYAVDMISYKVPATEILVGSYTTGKTWSRAYRYAVPPSFVQANATTSFLLGPPTTYVGDCMPAAEGLPSMLTYAGQTNYDGVYYFRDNGLREPFGLQPGGWTLAENTCNRSSLLVGTVGMIMVR